MNNQFKSFMEVEVPVLRPFRNISNKESLKRKTYTADFNYLMIKQKGFCANSKCAKINRIKQRVTSLRDLDHIYPIKLWEITNKKGNPNIRSNLQLLCPNCHRYKTAEDKKRIAEYKKKPKTGYNVNEGLDGGFKMPNFSKIKY